jgi:peptidoglycan/xylan/chitin deacetylase (PgdA/CDA1 family)
MTWAQVKALSQAGVEIGAHAHDHAILHPGQPDAEIRAQVQTSRAQVTAHTGSCRYFAYPVGGVKQIGPAALRAVKEAGFTAAFATISGTLPASRDLFLLPRVMLNRDARANASLFPFVSLRHDAGLAAAQARIALGQV